MDVGPGRNGDLHQNNALEVFGVPFQEPLEGLDPVDESFGVVQTVHAQHHPLILHHFGRRLGHLDKVMERNADGQWADVDGAIVELDVAQSAIHPAAESSLTAVDEIGAIIFDVESDQIAG